MTCDEVPMRLRVGIWGLSLFCFMLHFLTVFSSLKSLVALPVVSSPLPTSFEKTKKKGFIPTKTEQKEEG